MCLAKGSGDTYPMEIRTRRVIRRRFFGDAMELRRHPTVHDSDDIHRIRYSQPRSPRDMPTRRFRTVEPRPQTRSARLPSFSLPPSPIRSRPLGIRLPFLRRASGSEEEPEGGTDRGRRRDRRTFIVDPPRPCESISPGTPRSGTPRSSPRVRIQSVSPGRSPRLDTQESTVSANASESHRDTSPARPFRPTRPPRERSPSRERPRVRRGEPRPIIIQQDRSTSRGSVGVRRVRFAEGVGYMENTNRSRSRERPIAPKMSNDVIGEGVAREYGRTDNSPRQQYRSPERVPRIETRVPAVESRSETVRNQPGPEPTRPRPRIIQDGNRDLSQQAQSVYQQGRQRRATSFFHVTSPWRRAAERPRGSRPGSERIVYESDSQQRDGRWR